MRVFSLFSGGGLGDYGLELAGMEVAGQCEIDDYCQKILSLRWPDVPKWRDVHDVTGDAVSGRCGRIDVVSGGFPCQPFSVAGKQKGKQDNRYLWPEMFRVIREVAPTWVIAENVPGIIKFALDDVLHDLESAGYATVTLVLPAHALGAPHRRERVWIVGYAEHLGRDGSEVGLGTLSGDARTTARTDEASQSPRPGSEYGQMEAMADTESTKCERNRPKQSRKQDRLADYGWWAVEPAVGRVAYGSPDRVDRLKLLGNGQVVQAAQWIGEGVLNHAKGRR